MIKSYQQDFSNDYVNEINSNDNNKLQNLWNYYVGDNTVIKNTARYFYSDKQNKFVVNNYVANNKIAYGFFHDMVSQKVNTLLNETPTIENLDDELFNKNLGYALKKASIYASVYGYSFIFQSYNGKFKVFDSKNIIAYLDDENGELKVLINYWKIKDTLYYEVYNDEGISLNGGAVIPYKYKLNKSAFSEDIESINVKMPIVMLKNNSELTSDLNNSIKSKIDIIDIVNSGFANNIEDFSDIFWIIKNANPNLDSDYYEDLVANVSKGKKIFGDDIDTKQVQIPTEARNTFINLMVQQLYDESGVIDYKALTGGSLTNVAIKSATIKLQQRVSDFEWEVYNSCEELIYIYQSYNNKSFDFTIDFTYLLIQNKTELIDNAMKLVGNISQKSFLTLIKRANYIDNVDDEIKQMNKESLERFKLDEE